MDSSVKQIPCMEIVGGNHAASQAIQAPILIFLMSPETAPACGRQATNRPA